DRPDDPLPRDDAALGRRRPRRALPGSLSHAPRPRRLLRRERRDLGRGRHRARPVASARNPAAALDSLGLATMPAYTAQRISVMEASFGGGFVKARAELGVTAFGFQLIQLPPDYTDYPEHDHAESG